MFTMPYYRAVGQIPHKRHTQFRRSDGGLFAEELMGTEGFSSEAALLYHEGLPTAIVDAQDSGQGVRVVGRIDGFPVGRAGRIAPHRERHVSARGRAATDPSARGGEFYGPPGRGYTGHPVPVDSSPRSYDTGAQRRLWEESEQLTGVAYAI